MLQYNKTGETKNNIQNKNEEKEKQNNRTGIPVSIKKDFENLSGFSFDNVCVHYNSKKPSQIGALAYTQGNTIYIASGQEKHLRHELGHVLQQKRGSVLPRISYKSISFNNDNNLEKEADSFAEKSLAARRTENLYLDVGKNSTNVVQRKVGFEFETGWEVEAKVRTLRDNDGYWGKGFWREGGYSLINSKEQRFTKRPKNNIEGYSPLKKKDLIYRGKGFHIEADEAAGEKTELEFVTVPFENQEQLAEAMNAVTLMGERLLALANQANGEFIYEDFKIKPCDRTLSAGPQVTFGIRLNRLGEVFPNIVNGNSNIECLVSLIKDYINNGKKTSNGFEALPIQYPKEIANNILARTDFAKLLQLAMKDDLLTKYNFTQEDWLSRFEDIDRDLFERGVMTSQDGVSEDSYIPKLKIREWLIGIYKGVDKLAKIEDHEGMGEFGNNVDIVGGRSVGIFEYRQEQGNKIPLTEWRQYAFNKFNQITLRQ